MAQNYEDIVRDWYMKLEAPFMRHLTAKYPALTLYDAENIYQDTFLAIQKNLLEGRIKEDTSWSSYIMTIGLNLAAKEMRRIGKTDSVDDTPFDSDDDESATARKVDDILKVLPEGWDDDPIYTDKEAQAALGDALASTPEPCNTILTLFYKEKKSMDEIAERVGYRNATTAKSKKSQCMKVLTAKLLVSLRNFGLYDIYQTLKDKIDGKH